MKYQDEQCQNYALEHKIWHYLLLSNSTKLSMGKMPDLVPRSPVKI